MAQEIKNAKKMGGRVALSRFGKTGSILRTVPTGNVLSRHILVFLFCLASGIASQAQTELSASSGIPGRRITLAEALKSTLDHHPSLEIQHWEIAIAQGQKREASGQFDSVLSSSIGNQFVDTPLSSVDLSSLPSNLQVADSASNVSTYNLGFSKLFRNGINVSTFTGINRSTDNLLNRLGTNNSLSGVQVVLPLMQGRGSRVVGAKEKAAAMEAGSRLLDLRHTAELLLTNTANSYWNLVAAKNNLAIAAESEERAKVLLETVNALIEADQRPRNDIYEARATLSSRTADRLAAQEICAQARRQLALDMGLPISEILSVSDPEDSFPAVHFQDAAFDDEILHQYVALALRNRPDALAARTRKKQADVLLYSAKQFTKPQLNFQVQAGYSQLAEGSAFNNFVGSLFSDVHRPSLQTGLVYQFAQSNNVAEGQKLEAQANSREADLKLIELEREISNGVATAAENVQYSMRRVQNARQAVEAFRQTLDGEREEYRLGQVSLTELLNVEDRLTAALLSEVAAQQDYATAILNLRAATGTLLRPDARLDVNANAFETLPENTEGKGESSQR